MNLKNRIAGLVLGAGLAAASASGVAAATVGFQNIAGGDTVGDSLAGNFSLDISAFSATQVLIQVISAVNAGQSYFIGGVFIDDDPASVLSGEATAFSQANSSSAVRFAFSSTNGDLPQGNLVGFSQTAKYLRVNGQGNVWAVQPGEFLGLIFTGTASSVVAALNAGTLRFGLHVQGINGGSDSYVSQTLPPPPPVPLPAGGWLLLAGLGAFAAVRRGKRT